MMDQHIFLAIDLGASNGRVVIGRLGDNRLTLRVAHRFDHTIGCGDGYDRWDWERITAQVRHGLAVAGEQTGNTPIASVSCGGWSQDFGLLEADGQLLFPPVSYRDSRTAGLPQDFADLIAPHELRHRVGSAVAPITTLCQLRAMARQEPEILARAATLLHIADLTHYDLCGQAATDWTLATASQLRNVETGDWDRELLRDLGIPAHFLPEIVETPRVLGRVRPASAPHPKLAGVPVVIGSGHDTSAATAAIDPMQRGSLFMSVGTWAMVGCCTEMFELPQDLEDLSVAVLGLARGKWAIFHGGTGLWLMQECRRIWTEQGLPRTYDELAEAAAGSSVASIVDVNDARFFAPENMVQELQDACAEAGQEVPQEPGDVSRVIYDSLARSFAQSVTRLAEITEMNFESVTVVGGGSRDEYLCRRTAEELHLPVLAGPAEATVVGNILLQAQTLGILPSEEDTAKVLRNSFPQMCYEES